MKFKEFAYIITGPILQIGGAGYMVYGLLRNDWTSFSEGLGIWVGGKLLTERTKYVTRMFDSMNQRISELEEKLGGIEK